MNLDLKKFLLIVIAFGIIFLTFRTMSKAQATSDQCVQRIVFSDVTFCEYRLKEDSTEMFDFYRLSRGSPLDTVKVIYYTATTTGCSIFRAYTTHDCIDDFQEFTKERYPVVTSNIQATSNLDIEMCFKMQKEIKKKLNKIKKVKSCVIQF